MMLKLLVSVCLVGYALGYSSGAPANACGNLKPDHEFSAQATNPGYSISVFGLSDGTHKVTLSGTNSFKGFMIQAFNSANNIPIGRFTIPSSTSGTQLICNNAAVTHTVSGHPYTSVTLNWKGPRNTNVVFKATCVKAQNDFYEGVTTDITT